MATHKRGARRSYHFTGKQYMCLNCDSDKVPSGCSDLYYVNADSYSQTFCLFHIILVICWLADDDDDEQHPQLPVQSSRLRPKHAILRIDFSENAAIIEQDEEQSAHWAHNQVTIFTAVAWSQEGSNSFCITSDTMAHDQGKFRMTI